MADKLIQDLTAGAFALTDLLEHQPIAGPPSLKGDVAALVTLLNTIYAPITGGAYVLKAGDTMTGALLFTNNTVDIGAAGATSPRTGHFGTSLFVGGTTTSGLLGHRTFGAISFASDGVWALRDNAGTNFGRLQFGGTTAMFPALKRNAAVLQVRLADDSDFGTIETLTAIVNTFYNGGAAEPIKTTNPADGVWLISTFTAGAFNRMQLGGTTSSFPSIKRSAAIAQFRLADDSLFTEIECSNIITNNAGAAFSTNTTLTNFAAAALGTLANAPTAGNPAKWIAFDDNGTTRYIPTWI